jgi:CRP-like cAMP-binding protein
MPERLVAHEVFSFLRPEQVDAISERATRTRFAAGAIVYERGAKADHIYTVIEGAVTLHLPGAGGFSIAIDHLGQGDMFGSCICFQRDTYALTAQCAQDSQLLMVESAALKDLMDRDLQMGYALQTRLSAIYFGRYIETMRKLQAITMSLPIEHAPSA